MLDNGNVVIIDDNPNNLQVLTGILQDAGFKVRPALSGPIGLRAINAQPPDLVLLDIRMPEMDGYETCNALKTNPQTHDIPVIFISALNAIEDKLAAFRSGGVDYLTKPFQAEEVIARARTHIELARTRRSLTESNNRLRTLMDELVLTEKLRALGALAAGMSHELNTPIGNALLAASTIQEMVQPIQKHPERREESAIVDELVDTSLSCANLIIRNLERASGLIETMKEMSVDQTSERRRQINLNELIRNFVGGMQILLKRTPYTITYSIPADIVIETYPGPLEQVLTNLVQNAVLHGFDQAQSGTIEITASHAKDDDVILSVKDNGKGITAENLKRVFDPFFTTKLGQGGSGMGLHIVYNLARGILGGQIKVQSKPGQGAEFMLQLPRAAPESPS